MTQPPNASLIRAVLKGAGFSSVKVHVFDELHSTSVWLRDLSSELGSSITAPQLCATDWQTAGIARRGRTWNTKPGNITFSLISTTELLPKDLLGLSLVTGIAVASCLSEELGIQVSLKWPNDVLLNDSKLGGLLTEICSVSTVRRRPLDAERTDNVAKYRDVNQQGLTQILTGIGINMRHDEDVLALGIGATSVEAVGIESSAECRDRLIGRLGASVLTAHHLFFEQGWAPFAEHWKERDWLANREVFIHRDHLTEHAIARGVNEQGALLVELAGQLHPLYGGNVSIRPTV